MNNGKICVSVCGETVNEFIENIRRAEKFADLIELRFDCLRTAEIEKLLSKIKDFNCEFLITFRPIEDGGNRQISRDERLNFWKIISKFDNAKVLDIEPNLQTVLNLSNVTSIIASFHDFRGVPKNLSEIYNNLDATDSEIIKIAVQANDISDSITIWKLLIRAKSETKSFIPIAMGEAGKWTRILGLAHGAFTTFASIDSNKEVAPGQVSAKDLIEVYRAKELDENTAVYGIIGNPVSHSVSPEMQNAAFKFHNLNAVYIPFEVQNLDEFIKRMVKPETREIDLNFKGFSVTIPHKQSIIKHLDFIDETAQQIGAVNTVKIVDGKFHGYNTDAQGFIEPLKNVYGDLKDANVAILGAGGSARACVFALKKVGANVTIFARDIEKSKSLAEEFEIKLEDLSKIQNLKSKIHHDILVNTTPLGMKGKFESETPVIAKQIENVKLVYDLVFNPFQTKLMTEADKANVPKIAGMAMLIAQGMAQFKIWTGKDAPMKEMSQAVLRKLS